jgi:hypothetical protein
MTGIIAESMDISLADSNKWLVVCSTEISLFPKLPGDDVKAVPEKSAEATDNGHRAAKSVSVCGTARSLTSRPLGFCGSFRNSFRMATIQAVSVRMLCYHSSVVNVTSVTHRKTSDEIMTKQELRLKAETAWQ